MKRYIFVRMLYPCIFVRKSKDRFLRGRPFSWSPLTWWPVRNAKTLHNKTHLFEKLKFSSWWFQPIWKILVKIGIFPNQGWKLKNIWNHHPVLNEHRKKVVTTFSYLAYDYKYISSSNQKQAASCDHSSICEVGKPKLLEEFLFVTWQIYQKETYL